ncbi:MAG TPA: 3-oxoacyl-ACP reductase FabG [Candidatus Competibacteraceae bacterium]|nr:3-oxoacyl-ACP reductase FabG [Candidatus Competibacteraceae bacterium]
MKRALVTGGSGDIGSAICRRLAGEGMQVIVQANRHPERAEALVGEILQAGGSAQTVVFDVTNTAGTRQVLESVLEAGPVQVLVNNAGIYADAPLAGMSFEQWHRVIDVSLNGFFNVTQPLLLPMLRTRWGRIINISSVAAILGNRGQTNYAAAKAGLHGATRSLALELASRGVTVNAVAPGIIAGHITRQVFDATLIKRLVPMQRAGMPEEVAALVAFLSSEEAGYISGQIININGFMA